MKSVKLGQKVRDTLTGLEGTVVAKTEWLNGCWRITIQPNQLHEGKPVDMSVFDIEQLEAVDTKAAKMPEKRTGGDRPSTGHRN